MIGTSKCINRGIRISSTYMTVAKVIEKLYGLHKGHEDMIAFCKEGVAKQVLMAFVGLQWPLVPSCCSPMLSSLSELSEGLLKPLGSPSMGFRQAFDEHSIGSERLSMGTRWPIDSSTDQPFGSLSGATFMI